MTDQTNNDSSGEVARKKALVEKRARIKASKEFFDQFVQEGGIEALENLNKTMKTAVDEMANMDSEQKNN